MQNGPKLLLCCSRRQHDLRERFGFICECERCGPADAMLPASTTPFPPNAEGQDPSVGYDAGASACSDERRQPDAGKAHAASGNCGPRGVPEPDWFLSAVMPVGWGASCLQFYKQASADAGPAAGSAAGSQREAPCAAAAAAPGHERRAPPARPACERPFAALSPLELAAGPPGAAGMDQGTAAAPSAAARSAEERGPAPGLVSPMGTAESEAAVARMVAAGAAALLERGDAQRACAMLQDGLLQVRVHRVQLWSLRLLVIRRS